MLRVEVIKTLLKVKHIYKKKKELQYLLKRFGWQEYVGGSTNTL